MMPARRLAGRIQRTGSGFATPHNGDQLPAQNTVFEKTQIFPEIDRRPLERKMRLKLPLGIASCHKSPALPAGTSVVLPQDGPGQAQLAWPGQRTQENGTQLRQRELAQRTQDQHPPGRNTRYNSSATDWHAGRLWKSPTHVMQSNDASGNGNAPASASRLGYVLPWRRISTPAYL